jgi:hypothetical protein
MYTVYQLWSNFLVFFFVVALAPGIKLKESLIHYAVAGSIYASLILFVPKVIGFFKLNVNFWSFFIIGGILTMVYYVLMFYVIKGHLLFSIVTRDVEVFGLPFLTGLDLNSTGVILFGGMLTIGLVSFNQWLLDK